MITPQAYADIVKRLPPLMKSVLYNEALTSTCVALDDVFTLTPAQSRAMMNIVYEIIAQEYQADQVYTKVFQNVQLSEERSRLLAREIVGRVIMPMDWFLGNVDQVVIGLGGDPKFYRSEVAKYYPELSSGQQVSSTSTPGIEVTSFTPQPTSLSSTSTLLQDFEDRLTTFRGRAEILLRLTGLSAQIDEAMHAGKIQTADGEQLLQQLDTMSAAINTQDLNPFEIQSLKRRVERVVARCAELGLQTA